MTGIWGTEQPGGGELLKKKGLGKFGNVSWYIFTSFAEVKVRSLGWEDPLEKEMATHSSTLAWKIPWTEEPGRLQSMGLQRVGHDWVTSFHLPPWRTPEKRHMVCSRLGVGSPKRRRKRGFRKTSASSRREFWIDHLCWMYDHWTYPKDYKEIYFLLMNLYTIQLHMQKGTQLIIL